MAGWPPPTQPSSAGTSEPASDSSHTPPSEPGSPDSRKKQMKKGEVTYEISCIFEFTDVLDERSVRERKEH